jgi:hypothetical protein
MIVVDANVLRFLFRSPVIADNRQAIQPQPPTFDGTQRSACFSSITWFP